MAVLKSAITRLSTAVMMALALTVMPSRRSAITIFTAMVVMRSATTPAMRLTPRTTGGARRIPRRLTVAVTRRACRLFTTAITVPLTD